MAQPRLTAAGGLAALRYVLRKGKETGFWRLWTRLRSHNACKTCALGMGGQRGGMVNEAGHFPEVCKKGVQAMAADLQGAIPEAFFRETPLARLAWLTPKQLEDLGRLAFPLLAGPGDTHYRRISWEEALDRCAAAFREAPPQETFVYASGRASNEAAFLLQLVARAYGTSNVHNCSYYCHQASGVALGEVYGSGTASVALEDLAQADLAFLIGANPASNHPRLITQLVDLRQRGGAVIVVNPLKEMGLLRFRVPSRLRSFLFGSRVCDLYLQPRIGGDIALLKGLLKGVLEWGGVDGSFVADHTRGWEAVRADLEAADWEELVEASGVPRGEMDRAVDLLLEHRCGIGMWAMGLTHHAFGVDNVRALANLFLARGWLGRPGCGLLPIRGHSNVQGIGSMGVAPVMKEAFARRLQDLYGIPPLPPGQDTFRSMEAAAEGRIRASFQLGGNLFGSNPDRTWSSKALGAIPFTALVSTKLNENHVHGRGGTTLVLPCLTRDEEGQRTSQESMFNFVRLSEGGEEPVAGEPRSEVQILADLAERLLPAAEGPGSVEWARLRDHQALREEIGRAVPGYGEAPSGQEFQVEGRVLHEAAFPTPDRRARFAVTPLPRLDLGEGEFLLMTLRSEGQFNTVVYEEEDLYRGIPRRDAVLLNAADVARMGLKEGDRVKVRSEVGAKAATVFCVEIHEGCAAMYYPEANVLVPPKLDPRSRTPAFKSVVVRIEPWN